MRHLLANVGGLWQLGRLAIITRFDFKGPYWQWRLHTAFGDRPPESRMELLRAVLEYGRWMHAQRRAR